MQCELSDVDDPTHRAAVLAPLSAHNRQATGRTDAGLVLAVPLRDAEQRIVGGMWGSLWCGWLKLEFAFIPEHRRATGLGSRMLATIEAAAVARGASGMWMESFSFQAPGFYQKLGCRVVGVLEDRPVGHSSVFLAKNEGLGAAPAEMVVVENPAPEDRAAISAGLSAYNDGFSAGGYRGTLAVLVRDDAGAVIGGLWGRTSRGWLFVDLLGLPPEARSLGIGTRLMRMAEAEATRRGCVGVWLDTFSFQARPFYEKLGYTVFAQIAHYPDDHTRYFLSKRLDR